jgi:hypothetical protein
MIVGTKFRVWWLYKYEYEYTQLEWTTIIPFVYCSSSPNTIHPPCHTSILLMFALVCTTRTDSSRLPYEYL